MLGIEIDDGERRPLHERTIILGLRYESIFIVRSGIVVSGDSYHDNAKLLFTINEM